MSHRDKYNENMSFFDGQFSTPWLNSFLDILIPSGYTLGILEHDICLGKSLNSVSLNQNFSRFFTQLQYVWIHSDQELGLEKEWIDFKLVDKTKFLHSTCRRFSCEPIT